MGITAQKGRSGSAEAFEVNLMANPIAWARVINPHLSGNALEIEMVVVIFRSELGHIMIDVADRQFCADVSDAHRFKKQKNRCSGGILGEGLVNADSNGLARLKPALEQVALKDFTGECLTHSNILSIRKLYFLNFQLSKLL